MALNPRGQMPALVDGDVVVCESLAALLYLENAYPEHRLLPSGRKERALVRHCHSPARQGCLLPLYRIAGLLRCQQQDGSAPG